MPASLRTARLPLTRYLNYDNRYADLLFEVVTRRYLTSPVLITTNKPFSEWAEVFSSAAWVVTLVDRLIHRSEIVHLDGESYRLREAKEQAAKRSKARSRRGAKSRASRGPRSRTISPRHSSLSPLTSPTRPPRS